MKINEKQLAYMEKVIQDYYRFDLEHVSESSDWKKIYYYQDEEHNDSAVSMHVHFINGVEIISIDVDGYITRKSWL